MQSILTYLRFLTGIAIVCIPSWFHGILAAEQAAPEHLEGLQERLNIGEFAFVAEEASRQIDRIRVIGGNFDSRLANRYILLGDAQLGLIEPKDAIESFNLALHVTRMNEGLNSAQQLTALYRVSDAMVATGDYENANKAQERAYAIMLNQLGRATPQILPSMLKLIKWYESNRRYMAAKILYMEAIRIANRTIATDDMRRVDLARAFTSAMRNTVFPPTTDGTKFRSFEINVPGYEPPPPGTALPSSYALGLKALTAVVDFIKAHALHDHKRLAIAKLNLADWHQLFRKESKAARMYREIWGELDSMPDFRASVFDQPKLLYIRLPRYSKPPSVKASGIVELLLTVSYRGTVTGRISHVVEPQNRSLEFRTRVAARDARFRPALRDGKPVTTRNFQLTHRYPLADRSR